MRKFLTLIVITTFAMSVFAQSPQKMSYQCVIRNASGVLVTNHAVGIKISILQGSATGTVVFSETCSPVPQTNANGLLSIEIGSGTPAVGSFASIDWAAGPYFLKTETDPAGGTNYTIAGTSQLLSVPYALYAKTAANAFSGNYNDLSNKPLLFDGTWVSLNGKPTLAVVATSGKFADLSSRPSTLAGYEITDGMSTSHAANAITTANISNWNTAFGWGNHASMGYVPGKITLTINGTAFDLSANRSWNVGTVTSVGLTLPNIFSVSGSPVTAGGTLTATLALQPANRVFATHPSLAGPPSFRALVVTDIPDLSWSKITSGKPTTLTGYGITDAVDMTGDQTITGIKTFSRDLIVNGITLGKGSGAISTNTAIGDHALFSNTTGTGNTANGYHALRNNTTGNYNTANGYNALYSNSTGHQNTANGFLALYSNTTGYDNTANGHRALNSNTTGNFNTAIGFQALLSNTTGYYNTAIGASSLDYNTTGYQNTAIGCGALHFNSTGYYNTAIGMNALYYNITGNNNTANGADALSFNTTGIHNTANGAGVLHWNTSGSENTAIGSGALYRNSTGTNNTANGYNALSLNTTGYDNTANGADALRNNTTGYGNIANGSGVLIANTTGYYNTAIGSGALLANTTGYFNTANGSGAIMGNTTGIENTAIGSGALIVNTTGDYNTALGAIADVASGNLSNATAIGYCAKVNASNKVRIGNTDVVVIEGQVNWSVGSDIRLKDNVEYSDKLGLEFVNGLKTATFTYKNDSEKRHHDGLIAQDVKETLSRLGLNFSGIVESDNDEKTLNLSYAEFVIPLINSVKELSSKNQEQEKQIENQQKRIDKLEALVNNLSSGQIVQNNK